MVAKYLAAAVLAGGMALGGAAQADCKFQKMAEVTIIMQGQRPTTVAQVNGKDARFLVDTGAFFGGVTEEAGTALGMKHSLAPFGMVIEGVGGERREARAMRADLFTFAGVGFRNTDFLLLERADAGMAGMIGENLMGPFDVEYDFANGVMRYFKAEGCGPDANLAYWSQGMALSRAPMLDPPRIVNKVITNAKVDGHSIRVTWDSGSFQSVMSRNAAGRAGIQVTSAGVVNGGVSHGVFGRGIENFIAPFDSFKIGDEEIKNTKLRVADIDLPNADMLLGADFFLSHRILISNSQKKVYFTYNGGSVFRLDGPPPRQQQAQGQAQAHAGPAASGGDAAAAPGASTTSAPSDEPKTAVEFARRAAARTSRREFALAIADYTQAIALEPDNGAHYRARGMVRLLARQPVLAMADLDEALKRQPNDPEALLRRGELYLNAHDVPRAKADFDAAIKLAPDRPEFAAMAGAAYGNAGQFDLALEQLDAWVAAHPKADNLPAVLASRCSVRAIAGKDLDKALADCDLAMRGDRVSQTMQLRALVLLRLGRLDESIAQYAAAIKAQPRDAVALYGRGVAELKKGQKAEGDADIAAATALAPNVSGYYKRMGLASDAAKPQASAP
ncbi:aspartyl protease family protein [Phenylobacterium sp.]|uniref:aspartyl protease family protein n=1 Tax=Phenylobacterium sp. TaxID=1871053 RepID=UPI0012216F59|nr:aspartyl protease family protein [Phenylobacterium sp.]THD62878.1 MAG: tetratricopeptide repeat protein [Phenylobacterium sp.]